MNSPDLRQLWRRAVGANRGFEQPASQGWLPGFSEPQGVLIPPPAFSMFSRRSSLCGRVVSTQNSSQLP
jgi:hypothetical protein